MMDNVVKEMFKGSQWLDLLLGILGTTCMILGVLATLGKEPAKLLSAGNVGGEKDEDGAEILHGE